MRSGQQTGENRSPREIKEISFNRDRRFLINIFILNVILANEAYTIDVDWTSPNKGDEKAVSPGGPQTSARSFGQNVLRVSYCI